MAESQLSELVKLTEEILKMKKHLSFKRVLAIGLVIGLAAFLFGGCGGDTKTSDDSKNDKNGMTVLKIAASTTPHSEILNSIKEQLAGEGVDLQVKEYTDYVIPNTAVESGEMDANFFQHQPYLDDFNLKNGTHLVSVCAVHYEPMGIFPGKSKDLKNIPEGAQIAIPNDTTNEARALLMLADQGLITLPPDADLTTTPKDIVENPHKINFLELESAAIPRSLEDADFGIINGNYALSAELDADKALAFESDEIAKKYANIIAVKEGSEDSDAVKKLVAALESDACKEFINSTYGGMVLPVSK